MNNLTILTCDDIEATDLVAVLEAVNTLDTAPQVEHLKYLMADWWNAAGIFKDFATGMQDLRPSVADCISGCTFGDWLEVIWRQIGSTFRLVLIAEIDVSVLLDDKKSGGAHWQSAEAKQTVLLTKTRMTQKTHLKSFSGGRSVYNKPLYQPGLKPAYRDYWLIPINLSKSRIRKNNLTVSWEKIFRSFSKNQSLL